MKISKIVVFLLVLFGSTNYPVSFAAGDEFEPVFIDSLKACAGNKGKTAKKVYSISAGPDRVFVKDSITFTTESASGKKVGVWYHENQYEMKDVRLTVQGKSYTLPMPSKIVVEPWAETGSVSVGEVCAWNNGHIHAETIEIDP